MVDYVQIHLKAGNGGRGAVSFEQRRGTSLGRPDGGDGGKGGSVYLKASREANTLNEYKYVKDFKAENAEFGGRSRSKGKDGEDLYLKVPVGTVIKVPGREEVLVDLKEEGQTSLISMGGKGGRGNAHLKPSEKEKIESHRDWGIWRRFEEGGIGEEIDIILELKVLADVGLIGFPNAGKSTLLSVLTRAEPKIANYPFTTLEPNLGVMKNDLVLADIPGLIEGAHEGKGLGVQFLKHIERTKLLIHLIGADTSDPLESYQIINKELSEYSPKLKELPQIVVLNKIDILNDEKLEEIKEVFKKKKIDLLAISAATREGIDSLEKEIIKNWERIKN